MTNPRSGAVALTWMMLFAGLTVFGGLTVYFWLSGWWVLALLPGVLAVLMLYVIWGLLTGKYSAD